MNKFKLRFLVFSIWLTLFLCFHINAQSPSHIKGDVSDEHKAKVASAEVTLRSDSGLQFTTMTDQAGAFEFKDLLPGAYFLEVKASGFSSYSYDVIRLERGGTRQIDITLEVAAVNAGVVVTATGTFQRLEDAAKVVSVLDDQDIEQRHELGLAEALRGTPGIRVQQQGSPGALTTLRLRGQRNFDTAILLDGLRVRDAGDINGSAVSLISDLSAVSLDRIEILRGSGSSIYGTHAIGGVLNMIPDVGSKGFHFAASFEGGTLATYRERLSATGGGDRYGFNLGVDRLDVRDGIDGDDAYGNSSVAGRIQFHPSQTITVAGTFYGNIAN